MNIDISIRGQELHARAPLLAEHSVSKLFCRIEADGEWDGLAMRLIFRSINEIGLIARSTVVTDRSSVEVPAECIRSGYLFINAVGIGENGMTRLTTSDMVVGLKINSSTVMDPASDNPVQPSEYDQLLAVLGDLSSVPAEDTASVAVILRFLFDKLGAVSNLDTASKNDLVGAINELHGRAPTIVRAQSADGESYIAAANTYTPSVRAGSDGDHVGKGTQIVFIPTNTNIDQPTLSINGGEPIEIRVRTIADSGELTKQLSTGMLRAGVPYTMTFCGKYWLIDSSIPVLASVNDEAEAALMREFAAKAISISDSDTVAVPVINSMDELADGSKVGIAKIIRGETESSSDVDLVELPTVNKTKEIIDSGSSKIYVQEEEPKAAKDGDLWIDESEADENEPELDDGDFVTAEDMKAYVSETISSALSAIGYAEEVEY